MGSNLLAKPHWRMVGRHRSRAVPVWLHEGAGSEPAQSADLLYQRRYFSHFRRLPWGHLGVRAIPARGSDNALGFAHKPGLHLPISASLPRARQRAGERVRRGLRRGTSGWGCMSGVCTATTGASSSTSKGATACLAGRSSRSIPKATRCGSDRTADWYNRRYQRRQAASGDLRHGSRDVQQQHRLPYQRSTGRIYAGTGKGVDRLEPKTGHIRDFSSANGLAHGALKSAFRDRNGSLWFATTQGLSKLTPTALIPTADRPAAGPRVFVTDLRIGGVAIRYRRLGRRVSPGLNETVAEPASNRFRGDGL